MALAVGERFGWRVLVFTFIVRGEGSAWIEHLPILFAREATDQSAHRRAGGLFALTEFDERPTEDHLAARVAFALWLRLACLGGVKPSFGLLVFLGPHDVHEGFLRK